MPTTNARKHKIPAGGEQTTNRKTIFEDWGNSIRDVIPVANTTERGQIVTALAAAGETASASRPIVVLRADARGLHRIEYTTDGTTWLPSSGVLEFTSLTLATSFATSNAGLLTAGDRCRISGTEWRWTGTKWVPVGNGLIGASVYNPSTDLLVPTALTAIPGLTLADMPTGVPMIVEVSALAMNAGSGAQRFVDFRPFNGTTAVDKQRKFSLPYPIAGGHQFAINYSFEITPTSDTWSLQVLADQASSVTIGLASLKLSLKP